MFCAVFVIVLLLLSRSFAKTSFIQKHILFYKAYEHAFHALH